MKEFIKINGIDVGFADHPTENTIFLPGALDTRVTVRKGRLNINILTPELELTDKLHNGLLDHPYFDGKRRADYLRFTTYHDLALEGGRYNTQVTCPYGDSHTGFEVYGFPEPAKFHGVIDVQQGHIHIKGGLRTEGSGETELPIEIIKCFEAKPLIPPREKNTLAQALECDPLEVYEIHIGSGQFTSFPLEILSYKNLEHLWIGGQTQLQISELPEAFFELKSLHTVQIYHSDIERISERISQLQNLEELTIERSRLQQLPESLLKLPQLNRLSFKYGELQTLPIGLGNLSNLRELDIEGNRFKRLDSSLENIRGLKLDRKHRKLFSDTRYTSANPEPINQSLYYLDHYPEEKSKLEYQIDALPEFVPFKELVTDYSSIATFLVPDNTQEDIPIGRSKVGGAPDLPKSWQHPQEHGDLLVFHAQINCADIAPYQAYLPRTGMLYFFVSDEEYAQTAQVLYSEHADNLVRVNYDDETTFTDSDLDGDFREATAVHFANAISLPCFYNSANHGEERYPKHKALWDKMESDGDWDDKFDALEYDLIEQLETTIDTPLAYDNGHIQLRAHSINSSVFTQHESPQEWAAARYGGEPDEWLVLLCMESVGEFNFWDAGTLTYCIHKKDLAIRDFSRINATIESS